MYRSCFTYLKTIIIHESGPTLISVQRELAEEEARALASGKDFYLDSKVTPAVLISLGVELEAQQFVIHRFTIIPSSLVMAQAIAISRDQ